MCVFQALCVLLLLLLSQVRLAVEKERSCSHQDNAAAAAAPHVDRQEAAGVADSAGVSQQSSDPSTAAACHDTSSSRPQSQLQQGSRAMASVAGAAAEGEPTVSQSPAPGSLDIRDLSWVERERVLRLLFAKINGRAAKRRAAALPAHMPGVETHPAAACVAEGASDGE
jgi:hypothetical protein